MSPGKMLIAAISFAVMLIPAAHAKDRRVPFAAVPPSRIKPVRQMVHEWALPQDIRSRKLSIKVEKDIRYASIDIDDDGINEIFLLDTSHDSCEGTIGCGFSIWKRYGTKWRMI